jgi:hypothetical protein
MDKKADMPIRLVGLLILILTLAAPPLALATIQQHTFSITGSSGETGVGSFTWDDAVVPSGTFIGNMAPPLPSELLSIDITITGGNTPFGTINFTRATCTLASLDSTPDFATGIQFVCGGGSIELLPGLSPFEAILQGPTGPITLTFSEGSTAPAITPDPDEVITMSLEEPQDGAVYSGIGNIRGWVLSFEKIDRTELYIDGQLMGLIPFGGLRNDVRTKYSDVPGSGNSGYSMAFGYNGLTVGEHTVKVRAITDTGVFNEKSATFSVVKFHQPFFPNPNAVNLSNSEVDKDGSDIVIRNLSVGGKLYDVRLRWNTKSQGFELIEIR